MKPVDLLLITWNRREYVEKTLKKLLANDDDFRLYCWDNGSTDGAADIINEARDERIVEKHFCPVNVMQQFPTEWFLNKSQNEIIGKVDDDTLVPEGWVDDISSLIIEHNKIGMVGCWTYWQDDYERNKDVIDRIKTVNVGKHSLIQNIVIGGTAFLVRKKLAIDYFNDKGQGYAFPIDRVKMTVDGYISGWYKPIILAEHMDDPRSAHCLMNKSGALGVSASLSAKRRNINDAKTYLDWIKNDVDNHMNTSVADQIKNHYRSKSIVGKLVLKIKSLF